MITLEIIHHIYPRPYTDCNMYELVAITKRETVAIKTGQSLDIIRDWLALHGYEFPQIVECTNHQ